MPTPALSRSTITNFYGGFDPSRLRLTRFKNTHYVGVDTVAGFYTWASLLELFDDHEYQRWWTGQRPRVQEIAEHFDWMAFKPIVVAYRSDVPPGRPHLSTIDGLGETNAIKAKADREGIEGPIYVPVMIADCDDAHSEAELYVKINSGITVLSDKQLFFAQKFAEQGLNWAGPKPCTFIVEELAKIGVSICYGDHRKLANEIDSCSTMRHALHNLGRAGFRQFVTCLNTFRRPRSNCETNPPVGNNPPLETGRLSLELYANKTDLLDGLYKFLLRLNSRDTRTIVTALRYGWSAASILSMAAQGIRSPEGERIINAPTSSRRICTAEVIMASYEYGLRVSRTQEYKRRHASRRGRAASVPTP